MSIDKNRMQKIAEMAVSRKDFLKSTLVTAATLTGTGTIGSFLSLLSSPLQAENKKEDLIIESPVKSVIFINMAGGMSHIDTFDPKRGNGPFGTTSSSIRSVDLSDRLKRSAGELKRVSLIRSMHSTDGNHETAQHQLHTGKKPNAAFRDIPSMGALIAFAKSQPGPWFPQHVTIGHRSGIAGKGGFLGTAFDSFHISNPDRPLSNTKPARGRPGDERMLRRGLLLDLLNDSFAERTTSSEIERWREMEKSALDFLNSERLSVFEIGNESDTIKKRFGENRTGKSFLMARNLAKAEIPFIEIGIGGWDTHDNNKSRMEENLRDLDPALSALLGELGSSGLLGQTLIVLSSEFGRTPKISSNGDGRDHYPSAWTTLIGGGPIPGGRVIGATDAKGEKPISDPVSFAELTASIYKASGLDHETQLHNSEGRPFYLVDEANPVSSLFK